MHRTRTQVLHVRVCCMIDPPPGAHVLLDAAGVPVSDVVAGAVAAEEAGAASVWVRPAPLTTGRAGSPSVLLGALAAATSRCELGVLVRLSEEDPVRLAEDAAVTDLLSGERVQLALEGPRPAARRDRLEAALSGAVLARVPEGAQGLPAGEELRVRPHSPGLSSRLWAVDADPHEGADAPRPGLVRLRGDGGVRVRVRDLERGPELHRRATPPAPRAAPADDPADAPVPFGFFTPVPFPPGTEASALALRRAADLFVHAEEVGFASGWVRQRHFDSYLPAVLPFLAAVSQRTSALRLGTAVLGVRYEDPARLAADVAALDELSGRRLELGVAGGAMDLDAVYGPSALPSEEESWRRLDAVLALLDATPAGRPRVSWGSGSLTSARRAAQRGLGLVVSAVSTVAGGTFEQAQRRQVDAYREHLPAGTPGRVTVSRILLPSRTPAQERSYAAYERTRSQQGIAAARPVGALPPGPGTRPAAGSGAGPALRTGDVLLGSPERVLDRLARDEAVAAADELLVFLPPSFEHAEFCGILDTLAEHVAPHVPALLAQGATL